MALMLAMADASCAGIVDLVSLGMVNAAIIKMMVTTINSSMRVNPRCRLRLRIWDLFFVSSRAMQMLWLSAEFAIVAGYMDKRETAAKPELTSRLFFSRTAMSKEPVWVGRGWGKRWGWGGRYSLSAVRSSPELLAVSL